MEQEDIYKKIEAYLGEDMPLEEQKQFELRMAQDADLKQSVEVFNEINHHLHEEIWLSLERDNKHDKSVKYIENYIKSDDAIQLKSKLKKAGNHYKNKRSLPKIKYAITSIAAVFLIGLAFTFFYKSKLNNDLYTMYFDKDDLPSFVKRGPENKSLSKGIIAFRAQDYKKALPFFERYLNETQDPLIYSYIGFSYLETGDFKQALQIFDKLLLSDSLDKSRALWYKSMVYLKQGEDQELKKTLLEIISDSGNFNYDKAKQLVVQID